MENILEVKNLKKYYTIKRGLVKLEYIKAVDDVSFEIKKASTMGLVGESGCGKTTLARLIARLIEIDSGSIYFQGCNLVKLSSKEMQLKRKELQIIFQDPFNSLDPRFTVFRIISEGLNNFFKSNKKDILDYCKKILEDVGLSEEALFYYPHQFSGGERQRISIARSLVLNPKLLILDEPVSSLDVSIQAQIINLLLKLQEKLKLTYLFIAHDLNVIKYVSNEVCVMYLGKIVERATNEELFKNPLHPYTKLLLFSLPSLDRRKLQIIKEDKALEKVQNNGCPFFNRCDSSIEFCKNNIPKLTKISHNHWVSCFLVKENF